MPSLFHSNNSSMFSMNEVRLYLVDTRLMPISVLDFKDALTVDELKMLSKYKNEVTRKEKLVSLILKKEFIGEYHLDEHDKPVADHTFFNISHSHGVVALAISETIPVGIDLEILRDYKDDLARFIANDEEYEYIKDKQSFFEIWTSKESLVKCLGIGLKTKVKEIPALPLDGNKSHLENRYYSKSIKRGDFVISLTINSDEDFDVKVTHLSI